VRKSSIKSQIFTPIAAVIIGVVVVFAWFVASSQKEALEASYHESLAILAANAPNMMHTAAEEYAKSHEMSYYRVTEADKTEVTPEGRLAQEAFSAFRADASLERYERKIEIEGKSYLYVYAPGRIRDECTGCHEANGIDSFKDRKAGDLVSIFGVSGSTEKLEAEEARIQLFAAVAGVAIIAIILSVVNRVTNNVIIRPLQEFVLQSERVSEGDLTHVDTPELERRMDSPDEIGQMARAFRKMIAGLRTLISQVGEAAAAVASSSSEISASTEEMAAGAHEQTSQSAEVASAVEEMAKTIIENSRNARATAETSKNAKDAAMKGGKVVEQTVEGMKRIAAVVRKSSETVQALGKSSDHIGAIVSVIDDIADQTNLLALNAAIEAARAGEMGRGFAVVADEVRKLAERTTKATKEIASMIKSIQTDTGGAVTAMVEGTGEVERGILLADKAGEALREIVRISQNLTSMVSQIAAASEEQSGASEQISKNVEAISAVTGETASGTQQIARAAEDLNRLTDELQRLLSTFKLPQGSRESVEVRPAPRVKGHGRLSTLAVRQNGAIVHDA
jgi:methyl-accepting chemotaxis protein